MQAGRRTRALGSFIENEEPPTPDVSGHFDRFDKWLKAGKSAEEAGRLAREGQVPEIPSISAAPLAAPAIIPQELQAPEAPSNVIPARFSRDVPPVTTESIASAKAAAEAERAAYEAQRVTVTTKVKCR